MKIKYAVHPGWINSKHDGDLHFISARKLVRLYELKSNEYIVWKSDGYIWDDYIHLYPKYDGEYGRPNEMD